MKYESIINLVWAIIWAIVLIGAIVAIFWKPAIYFVATFAAVMFGNFVYDFIRFKRMK